MEHSERLHKRNKTLGGGGGGGGGAGQGTVRAPKTNGCFLGVHFSWGPPGPSGPLDIIHPIHPLATPLSDYRIKATELRNRVT